MMNTSVVAPPMHSRNSYVLAFLDANRQCWVNKKTKDNTSTVLTHTFMDGTFTGKLCIPPSLHDGFQYAVSRDLQAGTMPALNELRTLSVFHFFIDFDCHIPKEIKDEFSSTLIASHVVKEVHRFVNIPIRCVVLGTPDRDETDTVKRGIHLHFPDVVVSTHEALLMREAIIVCLESRLTKKVNWTEDYDNTPYVNSIGGLRVIGSPKAKNCPDCSDMTPTERKGCTTCYGQGKVVHMSQKYHLVTCLNESGSEDDSVHLLHNNPALLVKATSIRSTASAVMSSWKCIDGCPQYSTLKVHKNKAPVAGNKRRSYSEDSKSMGKWPKVDVVDKSKLDVLRKIFRTRFHKVYQNVDVSTVRYSAKTDSYYAQFSGDGECYCLNIMGRHKSNRVYGVVRGRNAFLKCHCSCAKLEGRQQNVYCRDFESHHARLTDNDYSKLFTGVTGSKSGTSFGKKTTSANDYLNNLSDTLNLANSMC